MERTFIFDSKYYKQTDGCTMGGPLSVTFSYILMTKMEKEAICLPRKPVFYKRFIDDIITRRPSNQLTDSLFELEQLSQQHPADM